MLIFNINEPGVVSFMYKVTNYVRTQCGCFRHKFNSCVQGFETPRKRLWNTRFVWFSCNIILYMNIQNILSVGVFLFFKFYVWINATQQHMKTDISWTRVKHGSLIFPYSNCWSAIVFKSILLISLFVLFFSPLPYSGLSWARWRPDCNSFTRCSACKPRA